MTVCVSTEGAAQRLVEVLAEEGVGLGVRDRPRLRWRARDPRGGVAPRPGVHRPGGEGCGPHRARHDRPPSGSPGAEGAGPPDRRVLRRPRHRATTSCTASTGWRATGEWSPVPSTVLHATTCCSSTAATTSSTSRREQIDILTPYTRRRVAVAQQARRIGLATNPGEGEAPRSSRSPASWWSSTRRGWSVSGHAFSPDTPWQREVEDAFGYVETADQLRAIEEVKQDMESPTPMDRLVCGDVGFGKTEVAVRAAFKAVQDGKQVAVLVPTTLLAQQHAQTFADRYRSMPVKRRDAVAVPHAGSGEGGSGGTCRRFGGRRRRYPPAS